MPVSFTSFFNKADTADGFYRSSKRLIRLESYYKFIFFVNVTRTVRNDPAGHFGIDIKNSASFSLERIEFFNFFPERKRPFGRSLQKGSIPFVGINVLVDKILQIRPEGPAAFL